MIKGLKGVCSHPTSSQIAPRPRVESSSIDFSQSLTQILSSMGNNFNENPWEGFAIVSACTDTWKDTLISRQQPGGENPELRALFSW